jgi:D-amino peptidase
MENLYKAEEKLSKLKDIRGGGMKIYIICDLEGAVGVIDHRAQCWPDGAHFQAARRMATTELNALVQGAVDGGATEIYAWDGHCSFPGMVDIELLHKDCRLIMGAADSGPVGLDGSFDALFQYGLHAMAGTPGAVLAHSFVAHIQDVWLNGDKIGEVGMNCAIAGSFGVPSVFISGDRAAVAEARSLVPQMEGVPVKEAMACYATGIQTAPAASLSVQQSSERIYEAAKAAVKKSAEITPYVIKPPYVFRIRYCGKEHADMQSARPGVSRIDDYTIEYTSERVSDFMF